MLATFLDNLQGSFNFVPIIRSHKMFNSRLKTINS